MTIQTFTNDHGVICCDKTERTDAPEHVTRIRFRGADAVVADDAMFVMLSVHPFYRPANSFGMQDGGGER